MQINETNLTRDQIFEIRRQAQVELARIFARDKNILGWGKVVFPDKFTLPFCAELHGYFVEIRNDPFTSTEAPRNHSKTTIKCFLIPIFQALEEPETFRHYLNVQATNEKALSINRAIKVEIETNEILLELYGNQVGERWTDQQFVLKNGIVFTAVGAGQSLRGLNYRNIRPDYIVVDDLYDEEDIENAEATEKKNRWFWGSLYPVRSKSRRCSFHVQGTAINEYDLLNQLKKRARWKCRCFQAIKDMDSKQVLWVELNTFESLMADLEDMGSIIFDREMQNERRDEKTSIVKRSWLYKLDGGSWEYDPIDLAKSISSGERVITSVCIGNDPSIGKKKESDSTGTALVIETKWTDGNGGTEYWIEDIRDEHLSLGNRIKQLIEIAAGRPKDSQISEVRIEAISAFDDYASEVIRRTNLPVRKIEYVKDKITVLVNKSKFFENRKVHLNKNIEQKLKNKLVDQLTNNHPKHDDLRDAVLLTMPDNSVVEADLILL